MSEGLVYGDYFLLGRLNQGGMAEVFLARATAAARSGDLLAVKRMLPQLTSDHDFVSMFSDEARIARGLSHPNICGISDQGEYAGQLYIVMEFIHGKDLRVVHRRAQSRGEPVPQRILAFILAKIAEALDYAHTKLNERGEEEGIVHRDVSPHNILISYDGVPKLIDFGIAKARDRVAKTRVGTVKGKFAYMSPEQAAGEPMDCRSDLYSLGVVLYEMLTGTLPFKGSGELSTLERIVRGEFVPVQELAPDTPRKLATVVERAMTKDPARRYVRGNDLAADLNRYLADERRDMSEAVVSSYMRRLFRDDYIREVARMKAYLSVDLAKALAASAQPEAATAASRPSERAATEETSSPLMLAAGYDATQVAAEVLLEPDPTAGMFDEKTLEVSAGAFMVEAEPRSTLRVNEQTLPPRLPHLVHQEPTLIGQPIPADAHDDDLTPRPGEPPAPPPEVSTVTPVVATKGLEADDFEIEIAVDAAPADGTFEGPAPVRSTPLPAAPRRLFTRAEAVILLLVGLLGVAVVAGAYWYASTMPL